VHFNKNLEETETTLKRKKVLIPEHVWQKFLYKQQEVIINVRNINLKLQEEQKRRCNLIHALHIFNLVLFTIVS
jgi:hypothetical protein